MDALDKVLLEKAENLETIRRYIEGSDLWVPVDDDNFAYTFSLQPGPIGCPFAWDQHQAHVIWFPGELIFDIKPACAPAFLVGDENDSKAMVAEIFGTPFIRRQADKPFFLLDKEDQKGIITAIRDWCKEHGINVLYQIVENRYESMEIKNENNKGHVSVYVDYIVRGTKIDEDKCVWHSGMADPHIRPFKRTWKT
jgi:hypothetical protein